MAFDASSRHPGFIIPSIREGLKAGTPVEGLALVSALWARMCYGVREDGSVIEPNDPQWDSLHKTAIAARETPAVWLAQTQFYGDLRQNESFAQAFETWLQKIWHLGVEATLDEYLSH